MKSIKTNIILLFIIFFLTSFIYNFNYNSQLNINTFNKLKVFGFTEGKGFIEYNANYSQKKAIWRLINNMSPSEKIALDDKAGGCSSFYFINNNIKIIFQLTDLQNNKLFITVIKIDKNDTILKTMYYISGTNLANKIDNLILNYYGLY